jgi:hypothetical protein
VLVCDFRHRPLARGVKYDFPAGERPRLDVFGGGSRSSTVSLRTWPMNWPCRRSRGKSRRRRMNQASVSRRTGTGMWGRKARSNAPAIFSLWVLPVLGTRRKRMGKEMTFPDRVRRVRPRPPTQFWARRDNWGDCAYGCGRSGWPPRGFGGVSQDHRIVDDQLDDQELGQGLQEPAYLGLWPTPVCARTRAPGVCNRWSSGSGGRCC